MKLLISDYDSCCGFSACSYIPRIGWKAYHDLELRILRGEFYNHDFVEEFAQTMFDKLPECNEIVVCQDGNIEIFHIDENNVVKRVEL